MQRRWHSRIHASVISAIAVAAIGAFGAALALWTRGERWHATTIATALAFIAFVALGELLEVPLERKATFSLGLAPALAYALIRNKVEPPSSPPRLAEIALVFVGGAVAATVFRLVRGRELRLPVLGARLLVIMAAASAYGAIIARNGDFLVFGPPMMSVIGMAAVLLVVVVLDVVLQSSLAVAEEQVGFGQATRDQLRATAPLLLSTVSVAALLALAYPAIGYWTLPLILAPLAATQYSFNQVVTIRTNYLQTVRALSKVPEMAGYTVRGHSSRVAKLSVEIAAELGIGDPELHDIEYAALLHDIGRISLPDPEETVASTSRIELAEVGAGIVENTGHFPHVAVMVRQQHEPYRRRGEDANPDLTRGGKIIKVASAFDDLTEPPGPGRTAWDAIERLHLGMAYDYDPQVIQALTRVLEARGAV